MDGTVAGASSAAVDADPKEQVGSSPPGLSVGRPRDEHADAARGRGRQVLLSLISFATMLLLWSLVSSLGVVSQLFLPTPAAIATTFVDLAARGYQGYTLWDHLWASLQRFGIGFLLTLVTAIPLGLVMGLSPSVRSVLDPVIEITRPMPKLALIPLFIIWFGIGETPKVAMLISAIFPILSISAMQGVKSVGVRKIQAAYSLGANDWQLFWRVILPGALPEIFTGIRVAVGIAVVVLVGAEMIATSVGIAWMALDASNYLLTNVTLVGVFLMAILGYSLDSLIRLLEARVVHWRGKEG